MRMLLLLSALLLLGGAAETAAPVGPSQRAAAAGVDAGSAFSRDSEAFIPILGTNADYVTAQDCPGAEANGTVCGKVRLWLAVGAADWHMGFLPSMLANGIAPAHMCHNPCMHCSISWCAGMPQQQMVSVPARVPQSIGSFGSRGHPHYCRAFSCAVAALTALQHNLSSCSLKHLNVFALIALLLPASACRPASCVCARPWPISTGSAIMCQTHGTMSWAGN